MTRRWGHLALGLCALIVFVPRPADGQTPQIGHPDHELVISQVLAPSIDAVEVREQDSAGSMREPVSTTWLIWLAAAGVLGLGERSVRIGERSSVDPGFPRGKARGSRAPPLTI